METAEYTVSAGGQAGLCCCMLRRSRGHIPPHPHSPTPKTLPFCPQLLAVPSINNELLWVQSRTVTQNCTW